MVTPLAHRDVVGAIPAACYVRSTARGLAYVARDALVYLIATTLLVVADAPIWWAPLWLVAALAISGLFVLAHDAAHGALFDDARLNTWVARLAFLPSLHALAAWQLGHNRVHHGHTGRAGIDFVWHPLSPADYARLPRRVRLRHRLEWSAWGAGLYYLRAVWWARMMRLVPPARFRASFRRDRALVVAMALLACGACLAVGALRTGTVAGATWTVVRALIVPWLLFNWIIGVTVYVHHIAPEVPWYPGHAWTRLGGAVDATTSHVPPRWLNLFWHNVYVHAPHHVDPRIPWYHLPRAADALASVLGDGVRPRPIGLRDYVAITRRCKLFDFDRGTWTGYPERDSRGVSQLCGG